MPETPAVNDLPERWRKRDNLHINDWCPCLHCIAAEHADELEAALARERAPHEEMARELFDLISENPYADATGVPAIAAALASVARTERSNALKEAAEMVRDAVHEYALCLNCVAH